MSAESCNIEKKSLGPGQCTQLPQMIRSMITTPQNFKFTAEQAGDPDLLEAAIQAALIAAPSSRIHIWPFFDTMEVLSEETTYEDTPLSIQKVRDGNYRFRFGIAQSLCLHKKMYSHNAKTGRVFLFDNENGLTGMLDSDGNFMGLSIQLLNTEKIMFNDGSVVSKSPVYVALRNNKELDTNGAIVTADYFGNFRLLTDVKLTIISASDTEIVVSVTIECDGSAVNGLADADFVFVDENGDAQSIALGSEDDGVYTLTGTGLVTGELSLVAPAANSLVSTLSLQSYPTDVIIAS